MSAADIEVLERSAPVRTRASGSRSSMAPASCSWRRASTPRAWATSPARPASRRARSTSISTARRSSSPNSSGKRRSVSRTRFSPSTTADHDVAAVLTRLGRAFVRFITAPKSMQAMRGVIAIAQRLPELGSDFYRSRAAACARHASPNISAPRSPPACSRSTTSTSRPGSSSIFPSRRSRARSSSVHPTGRARNASTRWSMRRCTCS